MLDLDATKKLTWPEKVRGSKLVRRNWSNVAEISSATGRVFHGKPYRNFDKTKRKFKDWWQPIDHKGQKEGEDSSCTHWNVVTTIYEPSLAVKRAAMIQGWCTVIVADTKTPQNYTKAADLEGDDSVHFLSVDDQLQWAKQNNAVGLFVRAIPFKHFARKNLGYLYAIMHGAQYVFDFDDDNILAEGTAPLSSETHLEGSRVVMLGNLGVFNHHGLMGAKVSNTGEIVSWPRGFPLDLIQNNATAGAVAYGGFNAPIESIAVMQFCADSNPDIDAIHRLVHPLPLIFAPNEHPLLVPNHALVPYNAQATVHTYPALWGLFLPFTVKGRVSDIWRGYFAQAIFRILGLHVAILPPRVIQERNEHSILGDFDAEIDLYLKSSKLVEFLASWQSDDGSTVPEMMEQLWINLYERGYIEEEDVNVLQLWLHALVEIGYDFPQPKRRQIDNVVLMGQFNFNAKSEEVIFWAQQWRRWFNRIVVRGPFEVDVTQELEKNAVSVHGSREDRGFVSPYENLMLTLRQYSNHSDIDGVLYLRDDALLSIDNLRDPIKDGQIVTTIKLENGPHTVKIDKDGTVRKPDGSSLSDGEIDALDKDWFYFKKCLEGFQRLNEDPESELIRDADGSIFVAERGDSDFLYVPTKYSVEFDRTASLLAKHDVFLECGLPKIVHSIKKETDVGVKNIQLCTNWLHGPQGRGSTKMVNDCRKIGDGRRFSMYHPFKLHDQGYRKFSDTLHLVNS